MTNYDSIFSTTSLTKPVVSSSRRLVGLGVLLVWVLLVVDGVFPQLQMLVLGNRVPIPSLLLKILLIVEMGILGVFYIRFKLPLYIIISWIVFVSYLILTIFISVVILKKPLDYYIFSINAYYFFLIIFPFVWVWEGIYSQKFLNSCLIYIFVFLSILGVWQFFSGNPILPIESLDKNFQVFSWGFYGQVRAFSLFSSSANFGHYIALIAGLATAFLLVEKKFRFWSLLLWIMTLLTTYATLTRATYLEVGCTVLAVGLFVSLKKLKKLSYAFPAVFGGLGFILAFGTSFIGQSFLNSNTLFQDESLRIRIQAWNNVSDQWLSAGLTTALFGTGSIQNSRFDTVKNVLVDSSFLAVGLHIGLFGLLLWIFMMSSLYIYSLKIAIINPSALNIASMAFMSTWILTGIYGVTISYYPLLLSLIILSKNKSHQRTLPYRENK